jgi:hypothetical protein
MVANCGGTTHPDAAIRRAGVSSYSKFCHSPEIEASQNVRFPMFSGKTDLSG